MSVSSQHRNALSRLPVPNSDRVIVRSRDNPRILSVEFDSANVVQVIAQSEDASLLLVVPNLNFVIVTTRHEERLVGMEGDASNGSCGSSAVQSGVLASILVFKG